MILKYHINRIVDEWNKLNNHIVSEQTIGGFKKVDKFMDGDYEWKLAEMFT